MSRDEQSSASKSSPKNAGDVETLGQLSRDYEKLRDELGKVIVGQESVIEQLLIALLAGGHCILEGVPGLAKTLMVSTLARTLSLKFSRIQFTPDLMPSDITGTEVISEDQKTGSRSMRFVKGPVFANVILADEINRTPPKTQSAMLEAMQERQVTTAGETYDLPRPFFVLATQNPIEQEGTYPLPEAQLDRFMLKILVGYPSEDQELQIVKRTSSAEEAAIDHTLSAERIRDIQRTVRAVPCAETTMRFAMNLVRATRPDQNEAPQVVRDFVSWGAGPRASQHLVLAAKARAALNGRKYVAPDDIRSVAHPVLRHRILTSFSAHAEGISSEEIIDRLLEEVPSGATGTLSESDAQKVFVDDNES